VLEVMPMMVCLLTPDYHVAFANRAFREKFGESHGRRCYEYCFGKKEPCDFCETYRVLKTAKPHHWQATTPDGASVIDVYDFPFTDVDGLPMILEMDIDITEQKRAEQALRDYQAALKSLASELSLAEERERRRIAAGIHDDIGQKLALAKMELQLLARPPGKSKIPASLDSVCARIDEAIKDAHSLTFELSNPALYDLSFAAAIDQWLLEQIQKKHGIKCTVIADEQAVPLDEKSKVVLFRALRELAVNVVKHAKATALTVTIEKLQDSVQITCKDDGLGFTPPEGGAGAPDAKGGFGLFNIKERLEYLGGGMKLESAPGRGTLITLSLPAAAGLPLERQNDADADEGRQ
jgi:signal transduction histidine kinase